MEVITKQRELLGFTDPNKLREINRKKNKKMAVQVIVSSNLSQEDDFEKAKLLGAKDYFVKSE